MFVESREESEAVFAGKRLVVQNSRTWHGNTAGFATHHRLPLKDMHLEATLRQFMGGAEARHTSPRILTFCGIPSFYAWGTVLRRFGRSVAGREYLGCYVGSEARLFRLDGARGREVG